jgi:hypothetical protein
VAAVASVINRGLKRILGASAGGTAGSGAGFAASGGGVVSAGAAAGGFSDSGGRRRGLRRSAGGGGVCSSLMNASNSKNAGERETKIVGVGWKPKVSLAVSTPANHVRDSIFK